ncbi:hypothetical protein VTK56DRAFT_6322 [Thermocarpiscus australiensis]
MTITAVLRGFKVPVAVLDRFLQANGLMETAGYPPFYGPDLDDASKLLRAKIDNSNNKTRLFIPYRMNRKQSTFAYVAYTWVFVYAQRKLHVAEELPDRAPEGFAELRNEIMGFAAEGGEGEQPQDEDLTGMFVVITDEQPFYFTEPFVRESDLRCADCGAAFAGFFEKLAHRRSAHGAEEDKADLPDDL